MINLPLWGSFFVTVIYTIFCAGVALHKGDWIIAIEKFWPMVLLWCPSPQQANSIIKNARL